MMMIKTSERSMTNFDLNLIKLQPFEWWRKQKSLIYRLKGVHCTLHTLYKHLPSIYCVIYQSKENWFGNLNSNVDG